MACLLTQLEKKKGAALSAVPEVKDSSGEGEDSHSLFCHVLTTVWAGRAMSLCLCVIHMQVSSLGGCHG